MSDMMRRDAELRQMLGNRRRALQDDVQGRIREGRNDRPTGVGDAIEHSDAGTQGDIALALLQMRADMLARIDEALVRLDAGHYGTCFECAGDIAEARLRALPFAVRCRACEERREQHQRRRARQHGGFSLFPDLVGF